MGHVWVIGPWIKLSIPKVYVSSSYRTLDQVIPTKVSYYWTLNHVISNMHHVMSCLWALDLHQDPCLRGTQAYSNTGFSVWNKSRCFIENTICTICMHILYINSTSIVQLLHSLSTLCSTKAYCIRKSANIMSFQN